MDEYSTWCRHVHVIHTTLKTALQTLIDSHKDQISGEDAKNYLGALDAFVRFLVHHHANEDKFEFPVLQKHSFAIVDELERDHVKLHQHIEGLQKIAASGTLDQQATKALLVSMQDFLVPHLNKEEAQVTPESLKAKGVKTEEIKQIQNSITEANKTLDGAVVLPMLYCKPTHLT